MSPGEIALLIGLLANALVGWLSLRGVKRDIHTIELATNSMKDALVLATGRAAHLAGANEARVEGEVKAAALAKTQPHVNQSE